MKKLLWMSALAVVLSLGAFAPKAEAGNSVVSQIFFNQLNRISDDSGDFLFNRAGPATILDVGDILITNFEVNRIEDLTGGGGSRDFGNGINNEFTGFSAIELVTKFGPADPGNPTPGSFFFGFGPVSAAGRAAVAANGTLPLNAALLAAMAPTSMVAFYDDGGTSDYARVFNGTFPGPDDVPGGPNPPGDIGIPGAFGVKEDLLASSTQTSPTPLFEFGFAGVAGEGWSATAPSDDVAIVAAGSPGINFGAVNFATDLTANFTTIIFGTVSGAPFFAGLHNFVGNANLQGVGLGTPDFADTPYDAFDDFNAIFRPQSLVPEPSSMALLALGSAGLMGFRAWRRRRLVQASN